MNRFAIAIIFTLSIAASALAQGAGAIKGTVTDDNGAKINGAQVILSSSAGVQLNTSTDQSGTFEYKNLRSGSYFVEVKANGFSTFTSDEILFTRGENKDLTVELRVAAINANVVITATGTAQRADEVAKWLTNLAILVVARARRECLATLRATSIHVSLQFDRRRESR